MKTSRFYILSIITVIFLMAAGTAWAGDGGRYGRHNRGDYGYGKGISRNEHRALDRERHRIHQFDRYAHTDGRVSRPERHRLHHMSERYDRRVKHFRHYDYHGYGPYRRHYVRPYYGGSYYSYDPEYRPYGYYPNSYFGFSTGLHLPGAYFSLSIGN